MGRHCVLHEGLAILEGKDLLMRDLKPNAINMRQNRQQARREVGESRRDSKQTGGMGGKPAATLRAAIHTHCEARAYQLGTAPAQVLSLPAAVH